MRTGRTVRLSILIETDAKLEDLARVTYIEFGDQNDRNGVAEPEAKILGDGDDPNEAPAVIVECEAVEVSRG